ncbi:hypothetical protein J4Q44_G00320780, partial [Coregonus suidteri]
SSDTIGGYLHISSEGEDQDAFAFEINHQQGTHFPVLDDSKATHFSTSWSNGCLKFGKCLKLYTENREMCVKSFDMIYHQSVTGPQYLDVELYRVGSAWRELSWTEETMTQHTSRLCKGYFTKKESDVVLHQMTWPP